MKTLRTKTLRRAVTLTELLVVMAIVSLLATLAVPVYVSQMQRARIATAQAEVRTIAEAQQMVAITHGFYVPIHVLDNLPVRSSNLGGSTNDRDSFDNGQFSTGNRFAIDATRSLEAQVNSNNGLPLDLVLDRTSNDDRVRRMIENWQGPFLNPRRVRYVGEDRITGEGGNITEDLVVDPWGNPYRFYTDFGIVGDDNAPTSVNQTLTLAMDNGRLRTAADEQDRFDRFAIVSYGPDMVTSFNNDPLDQGDDIFYTFSGIAFNETNYQFF